MHGKELACVTGLVEAASLEGFHAKHGSDEPSRRRATQPRTEISTARGAPGQTAEWLGLAIPSGQNPSTVTGAVFKSNAVEY
jgi:hypothetical protein